MNWVRIAIIAAVLAALAAAGLAVRSHLIGVGEARTQAQWDKQKAVDQAETLRLERERSADQLIKFRNAERISDEQAKREALRERRIRAGDAVADQLRSAIETLNRRDVSAAGSDPGSVALAEGAATARELFGSCNQALLGLAAEADRLSDQVAGLQDDAMFVCRAPKQTNMESAP
ncbi:hypothetical protein [Polaromonas sp.]|jgi:hypothetical protein|uniref:hypothetical protein n=2 Tax=Polaromonas TaxID=52972 RepID=UPI002C402F70|nr:hypothetical protein [Polaromonas sp.]HQR97592.1 hypothetical protein [Polaromonas sp.]HQS40086.1 hypothetical protein [Polaromonas sp.]HQS85474.1 hypothetical protein [Polaromonas sp.]HQT08696.1 hypothetical protein [Polaromonas sp.]